MDKKQTSKISFVLSVVALVLAAAVSMFQYDLWLAGTQWILISIVLAVYANYFNNCECGTEKKE